jgi:hypothetical protein
MNEASTGKLDGWWSSASEAEVNGQNVYLKMYDKEPENAIKAGCLVRIGNLILTTF